MRLRYFFCALVILGCVSIVAAEETFPILAPTANFTANVTSGSAPLTVQITDTSTGILEFNNWNEHFVYNNPPKPTTVTFTTPVLILNTTNYHWNDGRGSSSTGTIALKHQDGTIYGPWSTLGSPGMNGVPNTNWTARPSVTVKAGQYTVIDSMPSTWSHNYQSGDAGFSQIIYQPAESTVTPTPTPGSGIAIFDASTDFSSVRGWQNWYNNYDIDHPMVYGSNIWERLSWYAGPGSDASIYAETMHPGGGTQTATRRWVSPDDGQIQITGNARKQDKGGDGVNIGIYHNNNQIWQQNIGSHDTVGYDYNLSVPVLKGDTIDFDINCNGFQSYDSTYFSPTIQLTPDPSGTRVFGLNPKVMTGSTDARTQIYGRGFVPGTQARLTRNGTTVSTAASVYLASTTIIVATFDLSKVAIGAYDLSVEWPDHTIKTVPSAFQVASLPGGTRYQENDFTIDAGQTTTIPLSVYDSPRNLFVTLQKIRYSGDSHSNWEGTLTIERDGVEVATDTGNQDQIIQIPDPQPGEYTVSVIAGSENGHAILTVWDELPALIPGEWVVDRIHRPYGSTYRQLDLSLDQDTLRFDAQAMGDYSRFKIYNGQWNKGQAWISSMSPSASLTINDPPPGLYVVEFMDTQMTTGDDQARDVMLRASTTESLEPPPGYLPMIATITPTKGGNAGNVTIDVRGAWLNNWSSVSLVRSGFPDIAAAAITGDSTGTELTATFELSGKEPGAWELTIAKQDGQVVAAPFTIEAGGAADVQVEVLTRNIVRIERPFPIIVNVRNSGSLDAEDVWLFLTAIDSEIPVSDTQNQSSPTLMLASGSPDTDPIFLAPGQNYGRLSRVGAGETIQLVRYYKLSLGDPLAQSQRMESGDNQKSSLDSPQLNAVRCKPSLILPLPVSTTADEIEKQYKKYMDALAGDGPIQPFTADNYEKDYERFKPYFEDGQGKDIPTPDEYRKDVDDHNKNLPAGSKTSSTERAEYSDKGINISNDDLLSNSTPRENSILSNVTVSKSIGTTVDCEKCRDPGEPNFAEAFTNQEASPGDSETCGGGSVDPEDKYGVAGYSSSHFVKNDEPLSYRIDFWNAENATANVMDVDAFDQLDANLDLSTFGFSEVGFTNWRVPLDGAPSFDVYVDTRPSMPYIVHITGDMDPSTGKATLEYHTLDATTLEPPEDTVAGFLPPIATNEYGWFAYSVSPKPALATGTVIENQAFVNFDYTQYFPAPPLAPWVNTLDAGAPVSSLTATLVNETEINFTFTGSDDAGGSGVRDFTIYASDNGGAFAPFMSGVTGTTVIANGEANHTYRFFSIGTDNVGHVEAMKSAPEATVVVSSTPALIMVPGGSGLPRDLDGDGRYEDINGNGRKDFADVVLYFNQMTWIAQNEPAGALDFDYNNNDRIDFADVVWLFNNI